MTAQAAVVAAALALGAAPLAAHDMWLEPSTFLPRGGAIVGVGFRVGEHLLGDRLPRDPALVHEFVVEDAGGRRAVVGRDGADPAGLVRAGTPGLLVVGYRSRPSPVEQTHDTFTRYLHEEGLEAIAQLRARRGLAGPVREVFSRSAKALLQAGPVKPGDGDRVLGFPIELVAERNPYALRAGQELPVRLMYEGRPLAGALVVAVNRGKPMQALSARSGRDGRVRFTLPYSGLWLVKAVHMVEAPAGTGAEWASHWASLTFELEG